MSKKHYKQIAEILKRRKHAEDTATAVAVNCSLALVAYELCPILKLDNNNFQRQKFLTACGVED